MMGQGRAAPDILNLNVFAKDRLPYNASSRTCSRSESWSTTRTTADLRRLHNAWATESGVTAELHLKRLRRP